MASVDDFKNISKLFTVCIVNWQRTENIPKIVDAFKRQIMGDKIQFLIWNNNPKQTLNFPGRDVEILTAEQNHGSRAKLFLFSKAETPFVVGWDDDIIPKNNALFNMYQHLLRLEPEGSTAVTYHGRRFKVGWSTYYDIERLEESLDEEVDQFGPGCCLFRKKLVHPKLREEHGSDIMDDMWISFVFKTMHEARFWRLANPSHYIEWTADAADHGIYTIRHEEVVQLKTDFLQKTRKQWKKINNLTSPHSPVPVSSAAPAPASH